MLGINGSPQSLKAHREPAVSGNVRPSGTSCYNAHVILVCLFVCLSSEKSNLDSLA